MKPVGASKAPGDMKTRRPLVDPHGETQHGSHFCPPRLGSLEATVEAGYPCLDFGGHVGDFRIPPLRSDTIVSTTFFAKGVDYVQSLL
jgi:hypothetical protein